MASNITNANIEDDFPVAGQDNDSQGFRDNFSEIKTGLGTAATEITSLQSTTAKLNANNTFYDSENAVPVELINPRLREITKTYHQTGSQGSAQQVSPFDISFSGIEGGHYHKVTVGAVSPSVSANMTINVSGWPASGEYAEMRCEVFAQSGHAITVTFAAGLGSVLKTDGAAIWSSFVVNSATNPHIIDFWTTDGGNTVYAKYLGQFS
jgi:hypothetical protein